MGRKMSCDLITLGYALSEIGYGKSVSEAAKMFGIKYQTLNREWKKRSSLTTHKGREDRPYSKEQVLEIRELALQGMRWDAIAFKFDCTEFTAMNIGMGLTYSDIEGRVYSNRWPYYRDIFYYGTQETGSLNKKIKKTRNEIITYLMNEMGWSRHIAKDCLLSWMNSFGLLGITDDFLQFVLYTYQPKKVGRPRVSK